MLIHLISIVMVIQGDSLFTGKINQAEMSREGIFSGYVIDKVSGELSGEVASDASGEYIAIDGAVYYKGRKIIGKENSYVRLEKFKGYTLALFIPDRRVYILSGGRVKDSLKIDLEGINDIYRYENDLFLFGSGEIFTFTLSGRTEKFARFPVKNITGIKRQKGRWYVSTSEPGRIYEKVGKEWRVFYDPNITEVNAFAFIGDTLFVSGNQVQGNQLQGRVIAIYGNEETEIYKGSGVISGAGTWRGFVCGDAEDGQIAVFTTDGFKLIQDLPEKEIVDIHQEGRNIVICTGKPAGVYHMLRIKSKKGEYTTRVIDGGYGVKWGRVRWRGRGRIKVEYRTGRTSKIDTTWTGWRELKGGINSCDRYLQLKFSLVSGNDFIRFIELNYQPRNHPPMIKDYGVLPPGVGYGNADNSPFDRAMMDETQRARWKGMGFVIPDGSFLVKTAILRCVWWNAEDRDGDKLVFSLYIKRKGEKYRLINNAIQGNAYFIDASVYPEGEYYLKIVARDYETSFYPDSDYAEVDFLIDNTPPVLKSGKFKNGWYSGVVEDKLSPIYRVFYKFEGKDWYASIPEDGVFDEKKEGFRFMVPEGERKGALKIEDKLGNYKIIPLRFE